MFRSKVRCFDCSEMVWNLREHRVTCPNSRRNRCKIGNQGSVKKAQTASKTQLKPASTMDVFFALDVSSSMSGKRLAGAKEVIAETFDQLNEGDRVSLVTFDTGAFMKLKPRAVGQLRRQGEIEPLLARIFARGATALWDAASLVLQNVYDKTRRTKMIVVSDGEDNSSTKTRTQVETDFQKFPNIQLCFIQIGKRVAEHELFAKSVSGLCLTCEDIVNVKKPICQFIRIK